MKNHMKLGFIGVGLGFGLLGCGSSGANAGAASSQAGPPVFEITEQGSGETNQKPLFPLHAGSMVDGMRIRGERDLDGRRVFEVGRDGEPAALEGFERKYYSESDAGVLFHGTFNGGLFARPVLVVPKTVRSGMKWTADPGGGNKPVQCSVEYGARQQPAELVQQLRYWNITCAGGPASWTAQLSEGVGPRAGKTMDLRSGPAYPMKQRPTSQLTPLNAGKAILEKVFPHRVGSISLPSEGGKRRIVVDGEAVGFSTGGVVDVSNPGNNMAVTSFLPGKTRVCLSFDGNTFNEDASLDNEQDCPDPLGAAVGGDGKLRGIPPGNYCLENGDRCSSFSFYAIRGDADGAEVLVSSDVFNSARYHDGVDANRFYTIDEPIQRIGDKPGGLGLLDLHPYWLLFGERGSKDESLVIPDRLGSHLYAGAWDGHWHSPHPALVPAALSVALSKQERDLLDVTPDGTISRVTVRAGVLELSFLAQVALPPKHSAFGAIDVGDHLLVFTHADYLGWSTQIVPGTDPPQIDPDIEPDLGRIYAWSVTPQAAGEPEPPPPERTPVYTEASARDLRVCAADPWTPDGDYIVGDTAPAAAWATDEHCALLVRAPTDPSPLMPNGHVWESPQEFDGDLPRLGRVRVVAQNLKPNTTWASLDSESDVVPLSDGGFVSTLSPWHRFGPGGVLESYVDGLEGGQPVADTAGGGIWMVQPPTVDCQPTDGCRKVSLLGRERKDFALDHVVSPTVSVASAASGMLGGGIVVGTSVLRADGKIQPWAEPTNLAPGGKFDIGGVLEDATVCGHAQETVVADGLTTNVDKTLCVAPDGTVRTGPDSPIAYPPYYATADGVFYTGTATADEVAIFDPKAMTVTPLAASSLTSPWGRVKVVLTNSLRDGKGELFTSFTVTPPPTAQSLPLVLHLTKAGVEVLVMPTVPDLMFSMGRMAIDEHAFLFFGPQGSRDGVFRVLR